MANTDHLNSQLPKVVQYFNKIILLEKEIQVFTTLPLRFLN